MSDFTLQGDTTETPSSVIDLTNNSDLGKLRFNFDSSMENINTPITFADVGAEGHPVYVKNMNLTGTGGTGYGIYMAPNYSSVDNITLDNVVIHGRQFAVVTDFTASNIFIKNSDLSSNGAGFWGSWDRSINGLEFSGNNITNNSIGIWLNNVRNSDGSQFDASTIYHNNFYNNGLNISVDEGSGILALGGNFWGHVEAPCFYTVESGLIPADANRTGIDDLGCFTSENGWLP
jgi:hypothetical protein